VVLKDVPLVKKPGKEYNAPDVETIGARARQKTGHDSAV